MTKDLVILVLQRAIWRQPPQKGLFHHSDSGTQYCSKAYQALLDTSGIIKVIVMITPASNHFIVSLRKNGFFMRNIVP